MRVPKLSLHKASGQFYVRLGGRCHYLGRDRPAAEAEYNRRLAAWLAAGRPPAPPPAGSATVNDLAAAYLRHAENVLTTKELRSTRQALRPLCLLLGDRPAGEVTSADLERLREAMARGGWLTGRAKAVADARGQNAGWSRKHVNQAVGRVRRAFRWAVREGMIPAATWAELQAVENLRKGRRETKARETPPVLPADEAAIAALLAGPLTPPMLADMVRLQLATGMRPGELVRFRWADVDRDGSVVRRLTGRRVDLAGCWVYLPGLVAEGGRLRQEHKTAHHGHHRVVPLSPEARAVLAKYEGHPADLPIFSPRAARAQYNVQRRARRKSKVQPSQADRSVPGGRKPSARYTTEGYSKAVARALARVNRARASQDPPLPAVEVFHVNQLRHSAATRLVESMGWDVARMVLGHTTVATTRIYAADNLDRVFAALGKAS